MENKSYHHSELEAMKEHGQEWYEDYVKNRDPIKLATVVVTPSNPDVMEKWAGLYPMKGTYDLSSEIIKKHYNNKRLDCIVAGPVGLGATGGGGELGMIVNWVLEHKDYLKLLPFVFKSMRNGYKWYKKYEQEKGERLVRRKEIKIRLRIEIYLDTNQALDLIPYMQQLVIDYTSLRDELKEAIPYVSYTPSFMVRPMNSEGAMSLHISKDDPQLHHLNKIIESLEKLPPTTKDAILIFKRRFLRFQIIKERLRTDF